MVIFYKIYVESNVNILDFYSAFNNQKLLYSNQFIMLNKIVDAGTQYDLPAYLKRRVRPTNILALLLMFAIAIPFIIISLIYAPPLAIVPAVGFVTCVITIIANQMGGIKYSRIFLAMMPVALGAIYNAYLSNAEQEPIGSVFLIELAFSMVIFVVFDLREKKFLYPIIIYAGLLIITFPITKHWVNYDVDTHFIRFGWLSNVTVALGIITAFGSVLGLASLNQHSENQSDKLIKDMEAKNSDLLESEKRMKENLRIIEQNQEEEKKRNWATEGISKISEILRSHHDQEDIFDLIIATIVRYMNINQGSLYVLKEMKEGENTMIELKSCFAYDRKKFIEQEIEAGQGLLGQAYYEKDIIYMTEIPQNYIRITSGLGDANPTALIIVPLMVNEVVEGIIELASFNKFAPHEIEFLKKLGETIASFIQSDRINTKTKKLLEDSQQTAEELRAQEEEMKQNMEELAATQEEMARKEKEYQSIIEDLKNQVNEQSKRIAG